ncbi:MAG TPA: aspartate--tRNA(Asn) ligase [Streptosporangiaceae bacterium]|nr:aspartate--tRNA(Asn) ligase [Streptosporangiaceae bacterium]
MPRTKVCDLRSHLDETVTVCGWVDTLRLQRTMQFVVLREPSGMVQVTNRRSQQNGTEQVIESLTPQSAVAVTGRVVDNPIVKLGALELIPDHVEVLGRAEAPLPIDENSGPEPRLAWRYLDVRLRPAARLVFDIATTLEQGMREFAYGQGFTEVHTPKLMGTASESGAEVFTVGYFGRTAYLAQSPQFYKQMAVAAGIERVFEVGPVFRAEPSYTARHSTEFTGVDVEMAWVSGVEDVMAFQEQMLAHAIAAVARAHGPAVRETFGVDITVPTVPFPRLPMATALQVLRKQGWDPAGSREDLDAEGERRVCDHVSAQTGHEFVFVTHFPASVRPFYHMRPPGRPEETLSYDLLWQGLEVTTGAQREHRHDVLCAQATEKGMDLAPLQGYLDAFRYGMPPHGGFGLGLARMLMVMLGLESLREASFLFRSPNHLTP